MSGFDEGVAEKLKRKTKENPFVPIGCLLTLGALSAGLMAFRKGRKQQSQIMMRFRIFAQGFTIFALLGGVAWAARQKPEQKPIVAEPSSSQ